MMCVLIWADDSYGEQVSTLANPRLMRLRDGGIRGYAEAINGNVFQLVVAVILH